MPKHVMKGKSDARLVLFGQKRPRNDRFKKEFNEQDVEEDTSSNDKDCDMAPRTARVF